MRDPIDLASLTKKGCNMGEPHVWKWPAWRRLVLETSPSVAGFHVVA